MSRDYDRPKAADSHVESDERVQPDRGQNRHDSAGTRVSKDREEKQASDRGGSDPGKGKQPQKLSGSDSRRLYVQHAEDRRFRVPTRHNSVNDLAFDQLRTSLEELKPTPDLPYVTSETALDHEDSSRGPDRDRQSSRSDFVDRKPSFEGPEHSERNGESRDSFRVEHRERSRTQDSRSSLRNGIPGREEFSATPTSNYFDDPISFEDTLRPSEMAEICAVSKQKSFLLTLDQFLFILGKLEESNPEVKMGQVRSLTFRLVI